MSAATWFAPRTHRSVAVRTFWQVRSTLVPIHGLWVISVEADWRINLIGMLKLICRSGAEFVAIFHPLLVFVLEQLTIVRFMLLRSISLVERSVLAHSLFLVCFFR